MFRRLANFFCRLLGAEFTFNVFGTSRVCEVFGHVKYRPMGFARAVYCLRCKHVVKGNLDV